MCSTSDAAGIRLDSYRGGGIPDAWRGRTLSMDACLRQVSGAEVGPTRFWRRSGLTAFFRLQLFEAVPFNGLGAVPPIPLDLRQRRFHLDNHSAPPVLEVNDDITSAKRRYLGHVLCFLLRSLFLLLFRSQLRQLGAGSGSAGGEGEWQPGSAVGERGLFL